MAAQFRRLSTLTHKTPSFIRIFKDSGNHFKVSSTLPSRLYSDEPVRENVPISRFPIPDRSSLPQSVQDRLNEVEKKTGFLPNVLQALSHHPDEFECFFNYYDVLMEKDAGSLTKAERELIVVATSGTNNCLYCVVSHSAIHRIYSKQPYKADQVAINPDMADLTARERSIVDFALKIAQMQPISDEDFSNLEKEGLDQEDAWYIGAVASFFALSNRMAHLTSMRPNEEFYLMGRVKKEKN